VETRSVHPVYATLAGFALIGTGLCLARYAYTPLIPALINAGWVDKAGAGYLGGFNCLGYILGCIAALRLPGRVSVRWLLRGGVLVTGTGLALCAWNLGFAWLAFGRLVTGVGGALLVVHTPAVVLPHVPAAWKQVSNGIVFAGAGSVIALVSLLLPTFLAHGIAAGWLFEAGLAGVAAVIAWVLAGTAPDAAQHRDAAQRPLEAERRLPLGLIGTAYVLAAVGITPHMLFLSDYLHRDLGVSLAASMHFFALVGAGSLVGAATSGLLARALGTSFALLFNYGLGVAAVAMVLLTHSLTVASVSAFCIGFFLMQCVALTSMKTGEITGISRHPRWWGVLTLGFGLGLAIGAYGFSGLLALGLDYIDTFRVAQGILVVALVLFACSGLRRTYEVE